MEVQSNSLEKTDQIAKKIAEEISSGGIILLQGELGAGKTYLSKKILENLDIEENESASPTFQYIRYFSHHTKEIYHLDLYRIKGQDQLLENEIKEILEKKDIIAIIEWPQNLSLELPTKKTLVINIDYLDRNSRLFKIKSLN